MTGIGIEVERTETGGSMTGLTGGETEREANPGAGAADSAGGREAGLEIRRGTPSPETGQSGTRMTKLT